MCGRLAVRKCELEVRNVHELFNDRYHMDTSTLGLVSKYIQGYTPGFVQRIDRALRTVFISLDPGASFDWIHEALSAHAVDLIYRFSTSWKGYKTPCIIDQLLKRY